MTPDYLIAEIAEFSAKVDMLNNLETMCIWLVLCALAIIVVASIAYAKTDNDVFAVVAAGGVTLILGAIVIAVLAWLYGVWVDGQLEMLLAAYEEAYGAIV